MRRHCYHSSLILSCHRDIQKFMAPQWAQMKLGVQPQAHAIIIAEECYCRGRMAYNALYIHNRLQIQSCNNETLKTIAENPKITLLPDQLLCHKPGHGAHMHFPFRSPASPKPMSHSNPFPVPDYRDRIPSQWLSKIVAILTFSYVVHSSFIETPLLESTHGLEHVSVPVAGIYDVD